MNLIGYIGWGLMILAMVALFISAPSNFILAVAGLAFVFWLIAKVFPR